MSDRPIRIEKNPARVPAPFLFLPNRHTEPRAGVSIRRTVEGEPRPERPETRRVGRMAIMDGRDRLLLSGGIGQIEEDGVYENAAGERNFYRRGAQVALGEAGEMPQKVMDGDDYIATIPPAPAYVGADDIRAAEVRMIEGTGEAETRKSRSSDQREDRAARSARSRVVRGTQEGKDKAEREGPGGPVENPDAAAADKRAAEGKDPADGAAGSGDGDSSE